MDAELQKLMDAEQTPTMEEYLAHVGDNKQNQENQERLNAEMTARIYLLWVGYQRFPELCEKYELEGVRGITVVQRLVRAVGITAGMSLLSRDQIIAGVELLIETWPRPDLPDEMEQGEFAAFEKPERAKLVAEIGRLGGCAEIHRRWLARILSGEPRG